MAILNTHFNVDHIGGNRYLQGQTGCKIYAGGIWRRCLRLSFWGATFVLAGLCGICLYYLLENIALTYMMASNVGVIISVASFFTAILSRLFLKSEGKLRATFFIGFVVAMAGVALISFNGRGICIMVIDGNLSLGIIADTAAIMGITFGKQMPEVVGADVYDKTGNGHLGIIEFLVPILKGNVGKSKSRYGF